MKIVKLRIINFIRYSGLVIRYFRSRLYFQNTAQKVGERLVLPSCIFLHNLF